MPSQAVSTRFVMTPSRTDCTTFVYVSDGRCFGRMKIPSHARGLHTVRARTFRTAHGVRLGTRGNSGPATVSRHHVIGWTRRETLLEPINGSALNRRDDNDSGVRLFRRRDVVERACYATQSDDDDRGGGGVPKICRSDERRRRRRQSDVIRRPNTSLARDEGCDRVEC